MRFSWDEAKNGDNERKHGITFEQAAKLFSSGVDYLEIFDAAHSDLEDRFIAVGPLEHELVVIVWTERDDDTIRIISARRATRREQALYQAHLESRS